MASLAITDLHVQRDIDRNAMSFVRGAGAPWVFGWIQPFVPPTPPLGPVVNLYQTFNTFYANQVVNQFQNVDVSNAAPNSNLSVTVGESGANRLA